jgi:TolA-binding protein
MKHILSKLLSALLIAISVITLLSCSGNRAEELFKAAQLEEIQNNRKHARQLYMEIVKDYSVSEYAEKAESRLLTFGK